MRFGTILLFCAALRAERIPIGIVRGELLEFNVAGLEFSVRSSGAEVYRCRYDNRTYIEREGQRVYAAGLKTGDRLEIVADQKPGANYCYARTIRAADNSARVENPGYRLNLRQHRLVTDNFAPRGNLTFAGVILRMNPELMVVRTRRDGEKTVLLRHDTRYMDSGFPSDHSRLLVNTRIFVRGGKNLDNDLEAYQVIWGQLAGPR